MVHGVQLRRGMAAPLLTAEAAVARQLPQEVVAGRLLLEVNQLMLKVPRSPIAVQAAVLRWRELPALNSST